MTYALEMNPDRKLVLDALTALELEAKGYADRTRRLEPVIHALRKRLDAPDKTWEALHRIRLHAMQAQVGPKEYAVSQCMDIQEIVEAALK